MNIRTLAWSLVLGLVAEFVSFLAWVGFSERSYDWCDAYIRSCDVFHWPAIWVVENLPSSLTPNSKLIAVFMYGWLQFAVLIWAAMAIYKWSWPPEPEETQGQL